jgi:hypothetical protein
MIALKAVNPDCHPRELAMTTIRELNDIELDTVSGAAAVAGYKYCAMGPAKSSGTSGGLVPNNVDCGVSLNDVIGSFVGAFQKASGTKPA